MFRKLFQKPAQRRKTPQRPAKLGLTALEAREVPATFNVGEGFHVVADPVNEGGTLQFRVTPISPLPGIGNNATLGANFTTVDGTARVSDLDYAHRSGTLQWGPGDRSTKFVPVATNQDNKHESDETVGLSLTGVRYGTIPYSTGGSGTIRNDDAEPRISISNPRILESQSGAPAVSFAVTLSHPTSRTVSVRFQTADGTATTADADYAARSGTLTWHPGDPLTKIVAVTVRGDTKFEADETFHLALSNAVNAPLETSLGAATIVNDDAVPPTPRINVDSASVSEGNSGTQIVRFNLRLRACL